MNDPEPLPRKPIAEVIPFPSESERNLHEIANALRVALDLMNEADYRTFLSRIGRA